MDTKTALLGTEHQAMIGSERDILRAAVMSGLKQQAGYVPGVDDSPLPEAFLVGAVVTLAGDTVDLDYITQWCHGRAWVAGSAALWRYEFSRLDMGKEMAWNYHDIDLFAVSDDAYQSLYNDFHDMGCELLDETDNHTIFDGFAIDRADETIYFYEDINLVRPMKGQSWEHPASLFKTFDLSVCQVALGVGWAYVQHLDDVETKAISYGKGRDPIHLLNRIMKYLMRGYTLSDDFLDDVLSDKKCNDVVRLLDGLSDLRRDAQDSFDKLLVDAATVIEEARFSHYELDWDDIDVASERDDDEYDDDGDWWY